MPELPEVETIKRDLAVKIKDLKILDAQVFDRRVIFGIKPDIFAARMKNKTCVDFDRRGKSVIVRLKPKGFLVIQPKMSGYLMFGSASELQKTSATKAIFTLSNKNVLHYNDHRMFGWLYYVEDLAQVPYFDKLGPEPLSEHFTVEGLRKTLSRRSTPVKLALLNQELVAGIGNIYASEILFDCGIDPRRKSCDISEGEIKKLHCSIRNILLQAIKARGCSMRDYRDTSGQAGDFMNLIRVYSRDGQACVQCQKSIHKIVQAQRSTFFCSQCQK